MKTACINVIWIGVNMLVYVAFIDHPSIARELADPGLMYALFIQLAGTSYLMMPAVVRGIWEVL